MLELLIGALRKVDHVAHAPVNIPPDQPLRTIGYCIWCGRSPPEVELRAEHIIPASFGGHRTLPEGCCRDCEAPQTAYIGQCCRQMFPALRLHHGIARKRSSTKKVPTGIGNHEIRMLEPDIAPGIVTLPVMEFPDEITGARRAEEALAIYGWYIARTTDDCDDREVAQQVNSVVHVPLGHFIRTLAHIGHAFYMGAAPNPVREDSLLLPIAQGDLRYPTRVIGGWQHNVMELPEPGPNDGIHQIVPGYCEINEETYQMALIRLFTHLRPKPPVYICLAASSPIPRGKKYVRFTGQKGVDAIHIETPTMGA